MTKPGSNFAKAVRLIAQANGSHAAAAINAERQYGTASPIVEVIRAAVPGATTAATGWAKEAALANMNEFLGAVAEISVADKASRRVPLNRRLTGLVAGAAATWRAEGAPAAVGQMDLSLTGELQPLNVTGTIIVSTELVEFGDEQNEERLLQELIKSIVNKTDSVFASATAAVSNTSPAGILVGITPATATSNARADISTLIANFAGDLGRSVWIGRPQIFARLASDARIDVGLRGGSLLGAPAFATRNAVADTLILADSDAIVSGNDGFEVTSTTEGSVQMSDSPSGAAQHVSLWQSGLIAISVTRRFNFKVMRAGSVAAINAVAASW